MTSYDAGSAGPVFSSSRVLRWGNLSEEERERFARFCAESNVAVSLFAAPRPVRALTFLRPPPRAQFFKDTDGSYAANIRLYDASVIDAAATFGSRRTQVRRAESYFPREGT
jgi:hypothetical protein